MGLNKYLPGKFMEIALLGGSSFAWVDYLTLVSFTKEGLRVRDLREWRLAELVEILQTGDWGRDSS